MDRTELAISLNSIELILLERIGRLSEAASLIRDIRRESYKNDNGDEYLRMFTMLQKTYRDALRGLEKDLEEKEDYYWDQIINNIL